MLWYGECRLPESHVEPGFEPPASLGIESRAPVVFGGGRECSLSPFAWVTREKVAFLFFYPASSGTPWPRERTASPGCLHRVRMGVGYGRLPRSYSMKRSDS